MHHLINEYRPIQARDTIQTIMKAQIESINVSWWKLLYIFQGFYKFFQEVTIRLRDFLDAGRRLLNECYGEMRCFADTVEVNPVLVSYFKTVHSRTCIIRVSSLF